MERYEKYKMEKLRWIATIGIYDVECNWKLFVEKTNECYHCPTVHPETLKEYYRNHVPNDETKVHGQYALVHWNNCVQSSGNDSKSLHRGSARTLNLNDEEKNWMALAAVSPNSQLAITPDWVANLEGWPEGPNKTKVGFQLYAHEWSASDDYTEVITWLDYVNRQDWEIVRLQQEGSDLAYSSAASSTRLRERYTTSRGCMPNRSCKRTGRDGSKPIPGSNRSFFQECCDGVWLKN